MDAIGVVPYLRRLGISHLYSSPILTARAGSMHGYDVIDPTRINPELGGDEGFHALVARLRGEGLGVIVDVVPNHMAVGGSDNPWWLDVLEKGQASPYAIMFDIDWDPDQPSLRGKVLVPFLGKPLEDEIADGAVRLIWDQALRKLAFAYHDHRFPLREIDYADVTGGSDPQSADLTRINTQKNLTAILERQHFRLAFWRTAPEEINWRSFFDITGLAALRVEDERVFEAVHARLFQLYAEGLIDGMRVDHIDGLSDPSGYCRRLRARLGELEELRPPDAPAGPAYIVVEKILACGEQLPGEWPVDGTTGYDFMNDVSAVAHAGVGEAPMTRLWVTISGRPADFGTEELCARRELLRLSFNARLKTAAAAFRRLALFAAREHSQAALETALARILEHFRAYRTYAMGDATEPGPGPFFETAFAAAAGGPCAEDGAHAFIADTMRGALREFGSLAREAARAFNQLAAPLAAKAVEDTAFFRYGRLLSRNDVGFAPQRFAMPPRAFHARVEARRKRSPDTLIATATHDHKRGEDVRARLAVLSEWPARWQEEVSAWFEINTAHRGKAVERSDEYQLYQTLVGTWPARPPSDHSQEWAFYVERIRSWRLKSLREAKLRTSWNEPDLAFEKAHADFVDAVLDPSRSAAFLRRLGAFVARLAPAGALNGLTQCILRLTVPGVPDTYQGTEFWDHSLTDPDNRRAVDFLSRTQALDAARPLASLIGEWQNAHVKQALIARLLSLRAQMPRLFADGDYVPLSPSGLRRDHVLAFLRRHKTGVLFVAVPRLCAEACAERGLPLPPQGYWQETGFRLTGALSSWRNALTGEDASFGAEWTCAQLFRDFPGAVLIAPPRSAKDGMA